MAEQKKKGLQVIDELMKGEPKHSDHLDANLSLDTPQKVDMMSLFFDFQIKK